MEIVWRLFETFPLLSILVPEGGEIFSSGSLAQCLEVDLSAGGAPERFYHWSFVQLVSSLKNSNVRPIGT